MPERKETEESWITEVDSKYRLVLLAAKRSKQLQKGARPRVGAASRKATRVALEEVEKGLVRYTTITKEELDEE
jgi:DNA-directed RNA polymerase subunit omega